MNLVRLALVIALISFFLSTFGLVGAVLVTLLATSLVRVFSIVRIATLLRVRLAEILPWGQLAGIALCSIAAAPPAYWVSRTTTMPRLLMLVCAGGTYWTVYALIAYVALLWERGPVPLPATASRRTLEPQTLTLEP
jgi:hypothetical protein